MPNDEQERRALEALSESHSGLYVLDGHTPRPVADIGEWGEYMGGRASRRVARTEFPNGVSVSTVFLGIDHGWGEGPPVLFETMIFGGEHDQEMWRYTTWDEARQGHDNVVERLGIEGQDRSKMDFDDFIKTSAKLIEAQKKRRE